MLVKNLFRNKMINTLKSRMLSNKSCLNKYSQEITQKKERGAAQAMLYSLGYDIEDLKKPQVAVSSMWYSGNPCNSKLNILSDNVQKSIQQTDMLPMMFNTIGVSDGMSMGTLGMRYSLPSRDLIADSIETIVNAQHYDGIVCIPGCDKNLPGSLIALSRLNRPGLIIYGGSMKPSYYNGNKLDIVSAFESYGKYVKGTISEEERLNIIQNSCDKDCGSCSGLYTANTMAICLETMGITLPNSSSLPSMSKEKLTECDNIGLYMKTMLEKDIKPKDIITKKAFENAISMLYITGGSTNAVIHLLSIAKSIGIELTIDDFKNKEHVPVLLNMKPNGPNVMYDLHTIGGTSALLKYLILNDVIDGNCLTVSGDTLWGNVQDASDLDFSKQNIVYPLEHPIKADSHVKILRGNLAPDGCLSKIYKTDQNFVGKAIVFDSETEMVKALARDEITKDNFVILRYQGETIGCPEMLTPTSSLIGYFGENPPPLATDGRFSGGSHGILVAHLSDAYKQEGLTHLIENGDNIVINLKNHEINLDISEHEIEERRKKSVKRDPNINGYLLKYSKLCGNFSNGYLAE